MFLFSSELWFHPCVVLSPVSVWNCYDTSREMYQDPRWTHNLSRFEYNRYWLNNTVFEEVNETISPPRRARSASPSREPTRQIFHAQVRRPIYPPAEPVVPVLPRRALNPRIISELERLQPRYSSNVFESFFSVEDIPTLEEDLPGLYPVHSIIRQREQRLAARAFLVDLHRRAIPEHRFRVRTLAENWHQGNFLGFTELSAIVLADSFTNQVQVETTQVEDLVPADISLLEEHYNIREESHRARHRRREIRRIRRRLHRHQLRRELRRERRDLRRDLRRQHRSFIQPLVFQACEETCSHRNQPRPHVPQRDHLHQRSPTPLHQQTATATAQVMRSSPGDLHPPRPGNCHQQTAQVRRSSLGEPHSPQPGSSHHQAGLRQPGRGPQSCPERRVPHHPRRHRSHRRHHHRRHRHQLPSQVAAHGSNQDLPPLGRDQEFPLLGNRQDLSNSQ